MVSIMVFMGLNGIHFVFPMSLNGFDHGFYGFEWYSIRISHEFTWFQSWFIIWV